MGKLKDLTGQRFGKLIVESLAEIKNHRAYWHCRCDCGGTCVANGASLRNGETKSCGCLHREVLVKDLTGQRFGRLTVIEAAGMRHRCIQWKCRCECGNIVVIDGTSLRRGRSKSCGCLSKELFIERNTTHNMTGTPIHHTWSDMKQRCTNPKHNSYSRYGGRGITVCDEWLNSFQTFYDYVSKLEHFGEEGYSIDRIDNNGNYEPGNIRWATDAQQRHNQRSNVFVEYKGEKMVLAEAARRSGICYMTLSRRIKSGKTGEALFKKVETLEDL